MRSVLLVLVVATACRSNNDAAPPPNASVIQPQRTATSTGASVPTPLREIRVTDASGNSVTLADRMKDVTILAFWASWCGPCQAEMPLVDRYAQSEHDARITVIAVNIDENREDGVAAAAQRHYALPVVFDPDNRAYEALFHTQDAEIPAIAVVSRDGVESENGYDQGMTGAQHISHLRDLAHAHVH
ncbi:MAG TPA: TlpA disulfide reductase family protein [Kofleriaceae bacterium]|nr:TlpA disulfide reductase family protein [Kofleriaceae bacterium]